MECYYFCYYHHLYIHFYFSENHNQMTQPVSRQIIHHRTTHFTCRPNRNYNANNICLRSHVDGSRLLPMHGRYIQDPKLP